MSLATNTIGLFGLAEFSALRKAYIGQVSPHTLMPMPKEGDAFTLGGILAVIGLIALTQGQFQAALFLLGIGIIFMAKESEKFREKILEFFWSMFRSLVELFRLLLSM